MGYDDAVRHGSKQAVGRALVKPEWCRTYKVSRAEARTVYGIDEALIDTLLGMGFPCEGQGKDVVFDPLDLENIGLDLGLPSASRAAMSLWARSFKEPSRLAKAHCSIQMSWSCPTPGHEGGCDFTMSPKIRDQVVTEAINERSDGKAGLDVQLLNDDHMFQNGFSALVREAEKLHFHRLTPDLAEDMEFLREHRIADCKSASIYLAAVAAEAGLVVRQASGYFVGAPFLVPHIWLDVEVNGRWVAADPFFLQTLGRWGVIDADDWPPARSPRNVLWRIRNDHNKEPLIKHKAMDAPIKLIARMRYEHRGADCSG